MAEGIQMTTNRELKPCPFCGESKYIRLTHDDIQAGHTRTYGVFCMEGCGACISSIHMTEEDAIKAWNTRPTDKKDHKCGRPECESCNGKDAGEFGKKEGLVALDEAKLTAVILCVLLNYKGFNSLTIKQQVEVSMMIGKEIHSRFGTPKGVELDKNVIKQICHTALDIDGLHADAELMANFPFSILEIEKARDEIAESICDAARKGKLQ